MKESRPFFEDIIELHCYVIENVRVFFYNQISCDRDINNYEYHPS